MREEPQFAEQRKRSLRVIPMMLASGGTACLFAILGFAYNNEVLKWLCVPCAIVYIVIVVRDEVIYSLQIRKESTEAKDEQVRG